MPLVQPAKIVVFSNVPLFIKDEVIERELSRHKISLGCKLPQLKHELKIQSKLRAKISHKVQDWTLNMWYAVVAVLKKSFKHIMM